MNKRFRAFAIFLAGQTISLLGSAITGFALGIWAYQQTGVVTDFAMIALATALPAALLSPVAGSLVDRWKRKHILMVGQVLAVLMTGCLFALHYHQMLQVWHIVAINALAASANAFILPAINASIPLMVDKQDLSRANGMIALALGITQLAAPAIAGTLLVTQGMNTIFAIDMISFSAGVLVLIITAIPQPDKGEHDDPVSEGVFSALKYSWDYVSAKPSLLALIIFSALVAFNIQAIGILLTPTILGFATAQELGYIGSIAGIGTLLGGMLMMIWKGPEKLLTGVFWASLCLFCGYIIGPVQADVYSVGIAAVVVMACFPVIGALSQSFFQRKIPLAQQGRVFGIRAFVVGIAQPLAIIASGPLADYVFEPAMQPGGAWAQTLGVYFGTGPGRGSAVMISALGCIALMILLIGFSFRVIRDADLLLEDTLEDKYHQPLGAELGQAIDEGVARPSADSAIQKGFDRQV